ncbi:hypothetical protein [Aromatoleum sp.]|uniref:hypothetical protein n=1 Tax=Aromatoleum sp. TaxID=2307007 RepID=UPI002B46C3CC|nr:hypothetical protein [Aromatoleum sp.]
MSFFDSPVGRCEVVREMVLLDETQAECACEHDCAPGCDCPLKAYFAEQSGVSDPASLPCVKAKRARGASPKARMVAARKPTPLKPFIFAQKTPLPQRKVA